LAPVGRSVWCGRSRHEHDGPVMSERVAS